LGSVFSQRKHRVTAGPWRRQRRTPEKFAIDFLSMATAAARGGGHARSSKAANGVGCTPIGVVLFSRFLGSGAQWSIDNVFVPSSATSFRPQGSSKNIGCFMFVCCLRSLFFITSKIAHARTCNIRICEVLKWRFKSNCMNIKKYVLHLSYQVTLKNNIYLISNTDT
jgi:hypothetical protein